MTIGEDVLAKIRAEEEADAHKIVDGQYSRAELSLAFDMIADPANWKMPIDTIIRDNPKVRDAVAAAAIFFAACPVEFIQIGAKGYVRVVGAGYYACVGA